MNALLLSSIIALGAVGNVAQKEYNKRAINTVFLYGCMCSLFAALFFTVSSLSGGLNFTIEFLPYSMIFGISYLGANVFGFLSIKEGSLSLSALVISYSLILPTLYGLIFLDEEISATMIIALVLLIVSLAFINLEKKGEKKKITLKWIIYVALAFVSNGACSISQKVQQVNFNGAYKNEFMIVALVIVFVVLMTLSLVYEGKYLAHNMKNGILWFSFAGVSNGAMNLLVMVLSATMAASIMFPAISAGGIVVAFVISMLIYKEKYSILQYVGAGLGIAAVVLFNI